MTVSPESLKGRVCPADCQCTGYAQALAVDASHIFVLVRLVQRLCDSQDAHRAVLDVLGNHTCGGERTLVSSDECLKMEVTGFGKAGPPPELAAYVTSIDADLLFRSFSDSGWENLPPNFTSDRSRTFDDRDRRLAQAACAAAESLDSEACLVTDDEDFFQNLLTCIDRGLGVVPIHSARLVADLHSCGALSDEVLEALLDTETARLEADQSMSAHKKAAKRDALDRIADVAGLVIRRGDGAD